MLLNDIYADAVTYAAKAHAGQVRKGTDIPYISHPIAVSALVIENGGSEIQATAALLHDVLEDCGAHHGSEISNRFGPDVLRIVEGLTDSVPDQNGEKPEWRPRKEAYLAHLAEAPRDVVLVSACDKVHNATAIADDYASVGETVFDRFSQSRTSTIWYYEELVRVLSSRLGPDHRLARKLDAAVRRWAV
ncbi:HD domain-containing protein [Aestuariivirga sp.]|uniref:HD domain-containing protein n=1 Tax=Aestuariivirga sp. TaxID=2650926 RepID=UPI003592F7CC